MSLRALFAAVSLFLAPVAVAAPLEGLVIVEGAHDVPATVQRLKEAVEGAGLTLFATIDHAAGAEGVGLALRPTVLVVFGNPKVGTPLMQAGQTAGLDLPLRVLVYEDADGKTWLAYDDPAWIAARHAAEAAPSLPKMKEALPALVHGAAR